MTREEALKILHNSSVYHPMYLDALNMAIEALEQEPCDDEYIKVPKKALKYRTAGMVAYNVEWLKNHFDIERAVICGEQEPCTDAISRQAVLEVIEKCHCEEWVKADIGAPIEALQPVNPTEKVGQWIKDESSSIAYRCTVCNTLQHWSVIQQGRYHFCPNCGAKMVEPQESETWSGIHAHITAPKGTFEQIVNDTDDDDDI